MRRVCCVLTARASYSRIRSALLEIQKHPDLELQIIVAASALLDRYGDIRGILQADGLEITRELYSVVEGENLVSMPKTTGLLGIELASAFHGLKPDVVLTIADRHETLATAVAASYMNIPLAHVQGGEVTGSIDDKVRNAITQLADVHFVATEKAAVRVSRMRGDSEGVHVTGCPSIDLAREVMERSWDFGKVDRDLFLANGVGELVEARLPYVIVLQHPVTTESDQARQQIRDTLNGVRMARGRLADAFQVVYFWPNVDAGSGALAREVRIFREGLEDALRRVYFVKNLPPAEFLGLLRGARCIIGNSSVAIREASFMGVPAVNVGTRQNGRERAANVFDVERKAEHFMVDIMRAIQQQVGHGLYRPSTLYGDGHAGERIAKLLAEQWEAKAA